MAQTPHAGTVKMKLKTLILSLAASLVCSGTVAQVPGATPDTVKLRFLDPSDAVNGVNDGDFSIQILASLDSPVEGGHLGFSWSDIANWRIDSVTFGPGLLEFPIHTHTSIDLANSMGKMLIGGADFGFSPLPAGPDQLWATMHFSEKPASTWKTGDEMTIDSAFVPPGGGFLWAYVSGTLIHPNFTGAKLVFFTDVEIISDGTLLPETFALSQNYPNPFNPSTRISFDTPKRAHVTLAVYNVLGQQIRTLVNQELPAGRHSVTWEGDNDSGAKVASGMYFYKLISTDFVTSRKMMLVK